MVKFQTLIHKFENKGEKTGWTYIDIPAHIAGELKPNSRKSFKVKGTLDKYPFEGISLLPMGEGNFIMALNATIRKGIRKKEGATLEVALEIDTKEKPLSSDFMDCLTEEPEAKKTFETLTKSHQKYFSDWIESAKTDSTKTKRITQALEALSMGLGFPEMARRNKGK